jgi:hypothetical protein
MLIFVYVGDNMGRKIHEETLNHVIKAPTNLFFDTIPFGKLLGNLTTDIGKFDRYFFN